MEINFKEPSLEIYKLLGGYKNTLNESELISYINNKKMVGLYDILCKNSVLNLNTDFRKDLQTDSDELKNSVVGQIIDIENESEVLSHDIKLAEFYASIIDMKNFEMLVPSIIKRNPSSSLRMDIILCKIRMNIIVNDKENLFKAIEEGKDVVDHGCDWDRRNKFKSYYGLYLVTNYKFDEASDMFFSSLPTFESKELVSYNEIVVYYIYSALLTFKREEIKEKVIENGNVNETRESNIKAIQLVESFYECNYANILVHLYEFINEKVKDDIFIKKSTNFFIKKFISRIFGQLLESYKSLSLESMANLFGISEEFLESYLSEFIVDRSINCMIDKVNKIVFVTEKNVKEETLIAEKGNILMTHIKKNIK